MIWTTSHRADRRALPLADRHYSRQKPGTPQFVPPGRCFVLIHGKPATALWVTSWPFAQYVKHAWPGAWINSFFRKECGGLASDFILDAVAASRWYYGEPPALGLVTFVDPKKVPGVRVHGRTIYGYCYHRAGFEHVGFTKAGQWAWQLLPSRMPLAVPPRGVQLELIA